jgi:5-methylcytosine-specific restriction endonuclease McrA
MIDKKCTKCGEWKLFSEFRKDKKQKDGHTYHCKSCGKAYYQANRDCILNRQRNYYHENREVRLDYQKQWCANNKDWMVEYHKKYRQENSEYFSSYAREYYQKNLDYLTEYTKNYFKLNPEKVSLHSAKRRATKSSTVTKDPWELQQIVLFYADCPKKCHVDHIIPLSKGGRHELSNLQHLEAWMNMNKHAKHPDDWDDPRPISCRA